MTARDDRAPSAGASDLDANSRPKSAFGLMNRVKEALFEPSDPRARPARSAPTSVKSDGSFATYDGASELEANVFATLSKLLAEKRGQTLSEFLLQLEAVNDLVPDSVTRLRIALSVLEKKGIPKESLQLDLEQALAMVAEQERLFREKLEERRKAHGAELVRIDGEFSEQRRQLELDIENLSAALEGKRAALARTVGERDERARAVQTANDQLALKEAAFHAAERRVFAEYQTLSADLARLFREKS